MIGRPEAGPAHPKSSPQYVDKRATAQLGVYFEAKQHRHGPLQPAPPEPLPFTSILTETPSPFHADCRRDVAAPNEATIERFPPHRVTKNGPFNRTGVTYGDTILSETCPRRVP
ncbi:hypothetical protein MRX96_033098 [Rhipicephalus microplus]